MNRGMTVELSIQMRIRSFITASGMIILPVDGVVLFMDKQPIELRLLILYHAIALLSFLVMISVTHP